MSLQFIDPGPLIDRELTLVAPDLEHLEDLLAACAHPLSRREAEFSGYTRQQVTEFLRIAPAGRQPGHSSTCGPVPVQHLWMRLLRPTEMVDARAAPLPAGGSAEPPVRIAGTLSLRIGSNSDVEKYYGHLGYNVFPPARGNHYAERACRLILPLARAYGLRTLWITTNPDNVASRRTCQRLGAVLVEIVSVPPGHALYLRGERQKCRYRLDLA